MDTDVGLGNERCFDPTDSMRKCDDFVLHIEVVYSKFGVIIIDCTQTQMNSWIVGCGFRSDKATEPISIPSMVDLFIISCLVTNRTRPVWRSETLCSLDIVTVISALTDLLDLHA